MAVRTLQIDDSSSPPKVIATVVTPSSGNTIPLTIASAATRTVATDTQEQWPLAVVVDGVLIIDGALLVGG